MGKVEKLTTYINTVFFSYDDSRKILLNNSKFKSKLDNESKGKELNDVCKKISNSNINVVYLKNMDKNIHIAFSDYSEFRRHEQDDSLIYKVDNFNGNYSISTGIYCGIINLGDVFPKLEIKIGYSDMFLKRMLNYCCGIYVDNNVSGESENNESIYSLLIQYLFLISLRKVAVNDIPKRYVYLKERGYNIQGNIDIESYINQDLFSIDKKITYQYPSHLEIQNIVDVLYTALKACNINRNNKFMPDLSRFERHLGELYSGRRPTKRIINNTLKDKCLYNSLYSCYKKPLEYAKILLDNNDLNFGNSNKIQGISGFLVDASFLWEMYLYNLLKFYLTDWQIESQCEISFYDDAFFAKKNYPDFILTNKNTGKIFVLDAKFKMMNFENGDVDNDDIRQLHSYSYYFSLKEKNFFGGAALIYPTKAEPKDNNIDNMFGIKDINYKFGIFSIKDPSDSKKIVNNERCFIDKLKEFIES